jgi:hypothetical protein
VSLRIAIKQKAGSMIRPFLLLAGRRKMPPQRLVERFNRRITEAIGREPKRGSARRTFPCHADRDAFLNRFVADYNRTRLKCLGYLAPLEVLANLPGPNTKAGTHNHSRSLLSWMVLQTAQADQRWL